MSFMGARGLSPRHAQMRLRIARLAAQLMAEHGIHDFALAKRKAARQLGAPDSHSLPGNEEIEAEFRSHQALYRPDEHQSVLLALRRQALEVMQALERFAPILVGGVLNGSASHHSDIEIEIYTDSSKDFEHYLVNEGADFKIQDRGGQSAYLLYSEPANIRVRILPADGRQSSGRDQQDGPRQMTAKQLRQLLQDGC